MSALERFTLEVIVLLVLCCGGWVWHGYEVAQAEKRGDKAGYDRAVQAGEKARQAYADAALKTEREANAALRNRNEQLTEQERNNAIALSTLQRAAVAGTERLRCPASPVQHAATPAVAAPAGEPAADDGGTEILPAAAADVFGIGAGLARLVRKLDESNALYETCRAVNNGPVTE